MGRKRHTAEQIIGKLREAEVELAKGLTTGEVVWMLGITEQTYCRWKKKCGEMAPSEIQKMKQLKDENRRLKGLAGRWTARVPAARRALPCGS
jgi:putative transposase